jgi:hypothetical protein
LKYHKYLEETDIIDITPKIRATASLIASGDNDLFSVSQNVANWVVNNVQYDLSSITEEFSQKASWVFQNKQGVCDELSILYVSMMRSLGVPARMVYGTSYSNSDLFENPWNAHAWTEVYFPGHGWVPFDLTYNQFGFIDASHIKFKDSVGVAKISANYEWKGYDLDKIDIQVKPTDFDIRVASAQGSVATPFDLSLDVLYNAISIGSYNVLKIELQNNKDYYVSSLLHIALPPEVTLEQSSTLPIFLKPNEEKTYYVVMKTTNSLSPQYIYTMPIIVYTAFGDNFEHSFKAASKYEDISLDQINTYMMQHEVNSDKSDLVVRCEIGDKSIYVDQNTEIVCHY